MLKTKITTIRIFLFSILSILFVACKDDNKSETLLKIESQPMEIGSEWNYDCVGYTKAYDFYNQNKLVYVDSFNGPARVWVERDTLINDTLKLTVFNATGTTKYYLHTGKINTYDWATSEYKNIDKDGLKTHAYLQSSGLHIYAKDKNDFSPTNYFLNDVMFGFSPFKTNNDSLYFEEVPRLNIKLPLEINDKWSFRKPIENPFDIDKKVVGTELVKIGSKYFNCLVVEWIYNDPTGIKITDWISKEGLIKRKRLIEKVRAVDPYGSFTYYVDFEEYITLKNVKLN